MEKLAKYGEEFIFYISLKTTGSDSYQVNPTLAVGDVKVTQDGVDFGNIDTPPVVAPVGGTQVKVTVSVAELTGKQIQVQFIDVAGAEWKADTINISTYGYTGAQHPFFGEGVWDRILTGATHPINNSSGKRMREAAGKTIDSGTAQSGGTNTITLSATASATDGAYDPSMIAIISGSGSGQARLIFQYDGTTKVAVVDRNWKVNPDNTSEYILYANPGREHVNEGLAQGATSNTITLNVLASASDDAYIGQTLFIRSGTGDDQAGLIVGYNGTTKVATILSTWAITPDLTSAYVMLPISLHDDTKINALAGIATEARLSELDAANMPAILDLAATQEAVLSRLASSVFGSDVCPATVTVTDGTIISGDVNDCRTINQIYLKVQETGSFKIDFEFTGLSVTEDSINVIYRYFGPGSTNHKVECLMWNYQTSAWDDMLATDRDFLSSEEDRLVHIQISGIVSDYFTGASPNIAAKVRLDHISNPIIDHYFWIDFITLGELERIYIPADNAGITNIKEDIEDAVYGLSALRDLIEADAIGASTITLQYYETGGTIPIPDVSVSIYNSDQSKFLGRKYTDSNGQIVFGADDETYKIVAKKAASTFTVPETIVVTQDETFTLYGDEFSVPLPGDPDACNVYIDLVDLGVAKAAGVEFTAHLESAKAQKAGSTILKAGPFTMTTDSNGRIIMPLAKGYKYKITSEALGRYDQTVKIDTTDKDTLILADYLNT